MIFFNNKLLWLFFIVATHASCQNHGKLTVIADMPSNLKENSGIQSFTENALWVIEDNGNKDVIYKINLKGEITDQFKVKNGKNDDWEDLAKDVHGNLYIGDFGNNGNDKKELTIYKLPNPEKEKGDKIDAEQIEFSYPEQKKFPPKKDQLLYDAEAFFHWNKFLYIITKNRTRPYNGKALIYKVPDTKGKYKAELIGEFTAGKDKDACSITSADISPDGKKIVLLSYGYLYIFTDFELDNFYNGKKQRIDLGVRTQLEAVCFKNDSTLLISDEKSGSEGGNLYRLNLAHY